MGSPAPNPQIVHFADYVLDLETAELRRNGTRIVLQDQPFQILTILIEAQGHLVTREELIKRLWSAGTFVDFDQSLNQAVARLREALADSASQPRFVQTIPRRGYRWIASDPRSRGISISETHGTGQTELNHACIEESPQKLERPLTAADLSGERLQISGPIDENQNARFESAIGEDSYGRAGSLSANVWQIKRRVVYTIVFSLAFLTLVLWLISNSKSIFLRNDPIRTLAVLPLENRSGDPAQEYFADYATDLLINQLGRYSALHVISRTSVMQYKKTHKSLPQIARELNVDGVVEGGVIRSGDEVAITAELIYAPTDTQIWAESYQENIGDLLKLQERIAAAIVNKVDNNLNRRQLPGTNRSVDPRAFDDYLAGISQNTSIDGLQSSIHYFDEAVRKQPDFAEAYAGLASSYLELGHMLALPPEESFSKAKASALRAISLDESLADAHSILGETNLLYDWDFVAAEEQARRAIELNPNKVVVHALYVEVLLARGRFDEAMQQVRIKEVLDPVGAKKSHSKAAVNYYMRRFDESITHSRRALLADPNSYAAHLWLGLALEQTHQFPAALAELEKAVELSHNEQWIGFVAHDLAVSGDKNGARKILRQFQARARTEYVSPWWLAVIYSGLGEKEHALYWLNRAYEQREHDLVFSNCWPFFDSLRGDNRFHDLLGRIGLTTPNQLQTRP